MVRGCRMIKSDAEIALMQRASDITLAAYRHTIPRIAEGMRPSDIGAIMNRATAALGGDPEFSLVLLGEAAAFRQAVDDMVKPLAGRKIDKVAGIEARGFILGGAIAPGPRLLSEALARGGARLLAVEVDANVPALGRDTAEALRAGVVFGLRGAVRELVRRGDAVPSSMVLLSVVADTTLSNPAIRDVNDPIFNIDKLGGWTSYWPLNIDDPRDPRLSPLFMEDEILREFPPTTIYVGEREILYPDTLLLYQKAVAAGAPISVVVGTGQIHDWPLSGLAISSQTAAVRPDVFCELGLDQTCGAMV